MDPIRKILPILHREPQTPSFSERQIRALMLPRLPGHPPHPTSELLQAGESLSNRHLPICGDPAFDGGVRVAETQARAGSSAHAALLPRSTAKRQVWRTSRRLATQRASKTSFTTTAKPSSRTEVAVSPRRNTPCSTYCACSNRSTVIDSSSGCTIQYSGMPPSA